MADTVLFVSFSFCTLTPASFAFLTASCNFSSLTLTLMPSSFEPESVCLFEPEPSSLGDSAAFAYGAATDVQNITVANPNPDNTAKGFFLLFCDIKKSLHSSYYFNRLKQPTQKRI